MEELSENNFECGYSLYGNADPLIRITTLVKDRSIELMRQILNALHENPKLKAEINDLKITKSHNDDYVKRLQEENSELKQLKEMIQKHISDDFMWMDAKSLQSELRQLLKEDLKKVTF